MATAALVAASNLDLTTAATYPIRLGSTIRKPGGAPSYRSVRLNYKPKRERSGDAKPTVRRGDHGAEISLDVPTTDGDFIYSGTALSEDGTYALICRGHGKDAELTLERVDTNYSFNLTGTPSNVNAARLAEQYPTIPFEEPRDENVAPVDDPEDAPDSSNPFDYRHLLKPYAEPGDLTDDDDSTAPKLRSKPAEPESSANASMGAPPKRLQPKTQVGKKRKAPATGNPNPKRVKAGQEPPAATSAAVPRPKKIDIPRVRLDRRASTRKSSVDDSGELILENETPATEKPPPARSAMSLALSGQLGQGPISLRSAANSPASRVESPDLMTPPHHDPEAVVYHFDDSSPDADQSNDGMVDDADANDREARAAGTQSSAHARRSSHATTSGGDDEDDFDKALQLAMLEDQDGATVDSHGKGQAAAQNHESEESEEE